MRRDLSLALRPRQRRAVCSRCRLTLETISAPHRCPDELRHPTFDHYLRSVQGAYEQEKLVPDSLVWLLGDHAEANLRSFQIASALESLPDDDRDVAAAILEHAGALEFAQFTRQRAA